MPTNDDSNTKAARTWHNKLSCNTAVNSVDHPRDIYHEHTVPIGGTVYGELPRMSWTVSRFMCCRCGQIIVVPEVEEANRCNYNEMYCNDKTSTT